MSHCPHCRKLVFFDGRIEGFGPLCPTPLIFFIAIAAFSTQVLSHDQGVQAWLAPGGSPRPPRGSCRRGPMDRGRGLRGQLHRQGRRLWIFHLLEVRGSWRRRPRAVTSQRHPDLKTKCKQTLIFSWQHLSSIRSNFLGKDFSPPCLIWKLIGKTSEAWNNCA